MTEIFHDVTWPEVVRACVRLFTAALLGAVIGLERQMHGQYAGLRTHILVTLGAAGYVLSGLMVAEEVHGDPLRVLQGVVIGVGFLGSGTILKLEAAQRVRGLTTASGIWNAAAVGIAIGAGFLGIGLALTFITIVVLGVLRLVERKDRGRGQSAPHQD